MEKNFCIKKNIISEKSSKLYNKNCYVFEVDENANKLTIKDCIEKTFNVKVKSLNVSNTLTRTSTRYAKGYRTSKKIRNCKKAYVYLNKDQEINFNNINI